MILLLCTLANLCKHVDYGAYTEQVYSEFSDSNKTRKAIHTYKYSSQDDGIRGLK